MQINIRFLENLKLEAYFDDYKIISDQPIRYKGDGSAPGPFDYFLASSAMCAAYFVKVYCKSRNIDMSNILVSQDNIVDPENRYKQIFNIKVELPESISKKDREGILKSIDRCTVKKTIQQSPEFIVEAVNVLEKDSSFVFKEFSNQESKTFILGKDRCLEETIAKMTSKLNQLGIKIEISSWRNPVPNVWSVHIRDADSPLCYTNGKGATKLSALCSALGEYFERLSNNYFYNDYYLGEEISNSKFVHYPNEKWFPVPEDNSMPEELMDKNLLETYSNDNELMPWHLVDTNSGNSKRGICAIPFIRQSDNKTIYIPVNLIGNLFVSNGMSAGNTKYEARVQCLSEIFERAVKNNIISNEISLPTIPLSVLNNYPEIVAGIQELESKGFPVLVKDASLGGKYPVACVALMNPRTGGVFASFGSHPKLEIALERSLTELLQGRSFEGLNDVPPPTFNHYAVKEPNNLVDHFIDSTGIISWKFFKDEPDFKFSSWDYSGSTEDEFDYLINILKNLNKEIYIADYDDLGVAACRVLVPNYSEIYNNEDLIWDNNNKSLLFRSDILNLHDLSDSQLQNLLKKFEESELDDYMPIPELIGVAFDENSEWGKLVIGELKCLVHFALGDLDLAKEYVNQFLTFNDNLLDRNRFYQIVSIISEITISDELELDDYLPNLKRMYGPQLLNNAVSTVNGNLKFFGLNSGKNDKHEQLIKSYKKIHIHRQNNLS
ncbi:MAG: OsmC domain/YcaO domain-containing protein [Bdellovibrionales bacterium]|jgi:ribosomal protein S12 methylthiotransferase accessory factor|nr:OsmC domain/YcaO domain-containing protein [Bdellovibrionales bacterium]